MFSLLILPIFCNFWGYCNTPITRGKAKVVWQWDRVYLAAGNEILKQVKIYGITIHNAQ